MTHKKQLQRTLTQQHETVVFLLKNTMTDNDTGVDHAFANHEAMRMENDRSSEEKGQMPRRKRMRAGVGEG